MSQQGLLAVWRALGGVTGESFSDRRLRVPPYGAKYPGDETVGYTVCGVLFLHILFLRYNEDRINCFPESQTLNPLLGSSRTSTVSSVQ